MLGIVVAILAIFSYWLTLHQESPSNAALLIHPIPNFEISKISKFIQTTVQTGLHH